MKLQFGAPNSALRPTAILNISLTLNLHVDKFQKRKQRIWWWWWCVKMPSQLKTTNFSINHHYLQFKFLPLISCWKVLNAILRRLQERKLALKKILFQPASKNQQCTLVWNLNVLSQCFPTLCWSIHFALINPLMVQRAFS